MMTAPILPGLAQPERPPASLDIERLRSAAERLEASFLAEMLGAAGLGGSPAGFGGGAGEDQFASFLVTAQADEMARAGGIGLAESLFEALKAQSLDV